MDTLSLGIAQMMRRTAVIFEKKRVAFCFDGSVSTQVKYDKPDDISDKTVAGIQMLFQRLYVTGYEIIVFSARCKQLEGFKAVTHWLCQHCLIEYVASVIPYAPECGVVVDRRCVKAVDIQEMIKEIGAKERRYEEE